MKNTNFLGTFLLLVAMSFMLSGCDVIAGIFEAGFWVGIVLAIIIIGGLFAIFRGGGRK